MRSIAKVEKTTLIVAPHLSHRKKWNMAIFCFVLVAGGARKIRRQVTGLCVDAGAVVFITAAGIGEIAKLCGSDCIRIFLWTSRKWIGCVEILDRICAELPIVRFSAHQSVMPVLAGSE